MTTEFERISFLLEVEAEWREARDEALAAEAAGKPDDDTIEAARDLPPYVTNFIGSKQKLVDWIWVHTPDGVKSVLDAFSGSAVVGYMFKTKDYTSYCSSMIVSDTTFENRRRSVRLLPWLLTGGSLPGGSYR